MNKGKLTILIVEDNQHVQYMVMQCLLEAGYYCDTAKNGWEAVQKVRESYFSAILMDIDMPILNGIGATRVIRRSFGFDTIPIIGFATNTHIGIRAKCIEAGMNAVVCKSDGLKMMLNTISSAITFGEIP